MGAKPFNARHGFTVGNDISILDINGNIACTNLSGTNTGDETNASIVSKLGGTLISLSNSIPLVDTVDGYAGVSNAASRADHQHQEDGIISIYTGKVGVVSGTTIIPFDNTAPLVTEGTQLWSQTFTPKSASSKNIIEFSGITDASGSNSVITIAIFKGNTFLGFVTNSSTGGSGSRPGNFSIRLEDANTSLTPVTYSCRIGIEASNTWYIGRPQSVTMGGVNSSAWSIMEKL